MISSRPPLEAIWGVASRTTHGSHWATTPDHGRTHAPSEAVARQSVLQLRRGRIGAVRRSLVACLILTGALTRGCGHTVTGSGQVVRQELRVQAIT